MSVTVIFNTSLVIMIVCCHAAHYHNNKICNIYRGRGRDRELGHQWVTHAAVIITGCCDEVGHVINHNSYKVSMSPATKQ